MQKRTNPDVDASDRCVMWKMARTGRDGKIKDECTKKVIDEIVSFFFLNCCTLIIVSDWLMLRSFLFNSFRMP